LDQLLADVEDITASECDDQTLQDASKALGELKADAGSGCGAADQPMKYRKLRIAWSVGCGIVCLLLIALWVRSYWWSDELTLASRLEFISAYG
jgi:hypothetical protein